MSVIAPLRLCRAPATAFVIVGLYWGAFAANVPVIKARIGASDGEFGALLLSSALGLVSAMWLAPRADRLFGARGLPLAALVLAGAFLLPGLAIGPASFALAMVLAGAASGLTDVIMNARVSELESRHSRSLMNANHGAFSAAYAASAVAAGLAREAGTPTVATFAALGVVTLLLAPGLAAAPEHTPSRGAAARGSSLGPVIMCGAIVLVAFMAEATVESWSALFIERELGGSAAQGALGPAMLGLTMAVGRFSGQAVSVRLRPSQVVVWASLMAAAGALVAAAAPVPAVAYAGFAVLGLGVSVIGPLGLAMVGQLVAPADRTAAIARTAVIGFSGFVIAPVLMGGLSELVGLGAAFGAVALLLALAPLPLPWIRARNSLL
ncbi:Cyanate permease [Meinhardsimonia xiamenensis]|jgi:MFS family permease|uniref:Cyanate permease n=1 Tax=Meinhardsimonia xiamenensis TaxID=990712 RepID=A0A1G8Z6N4_9RHOB|nr:MFS transporter [Meinhardsimonia xiamenensis]PRX37574.1 cyanate permease [Meinhardsimonia xiamenensis]SDK10653.1 Cyanate permease [Meinhardsimonia xiamenensis]